MSRTPIFEQATNWAGYMDRPEWNFMDSLTREQIARILEAESHTSEVTELYFIHTLTNSPTLTRIYIPRHNA